MLNTSLGQLIGHGHLFSDTFLDADRFVRYCNERGLGISEEQLERFERLGIFLPLIRLRWPKIKIKIATRDNGKEYEELGVLQEDEDWQGEVREANGGFSWWNKDTIQWLIDKGYLWIPAQEHFQSWTNYRDETGRWTVFSYYSIFQTLPLYNYLKLTTIQVGYDKIADWSKEDAVSWFETWKPRAEQVVTKLGTEEDASKTAAKLCQALSSRYFPYAQSDGTEITIPNPELFDWSKFNREWSASDFLETIGLTVESVAHCWQIVSTLTRHTDPLDSWQDFVSFFRRGQKERLKKEALLTQGWRTMEAILNLFHEDLTGKRLYEFDRSPEDKESYYGKDVPRDDLKFLEFLTNRYGVNPRPKLILVVEGNGEEKQFPRMAEELLALSFPELRIAVMNIKGIGGFKNLKHIIDHYHSLQTIVFVILDKENNAEHTKEKLCRAPSIWRPKRTITKDDYIYLWNKNVEFDNFTDKEIAQGMAHVCERRYYFSPEEITKCRQAFGRRRDPLSKLYKEKLNYDLCKPDLLKALFDYAIADPEIEIDGNKIRRPIVDVILEVQRLALRNHQPSYFDAWQKTQDSDWLGNISEAG